MRMSLSPMQTLSFACPECGCILNKAENQATDSDVIENLQACSSPEAPVQSLPKKQCGKCGSWYYPDTQPKRRRRKTK